MKWITHGFFAYIVFFFYFGWCQKRKEKINIKTLFLCCLTLQVAAVCCCSSRKKNILTEIFTNILNTRTFKIHFKRIFCLFFCLSSLALVLPHIENIFPCTHSTRPRQLTKLELLSEFFNLDSFFSLFSLFFLLFFLYP